MRINMTECGIQTAEKDRNRKDIEVKGIVQSQSTRACCLRLMGTAGSNKNRTIWCNIDQNHEPVANAY